MKKLNWEWERGRRTEERERDQKRWSLFNFTNGTDQARAARLERTPQIKNKAETNSYSNNNNTNNTNNNNNKKPVRDCDYNCSACTQSKHKTADEGSTAELSRAEHDDSHALSLYRTGRATSCTLYYSVTCARSLAHTQAHKCLISIGIFWRWRCCGVDCEWQMGVRERKKKKKQQQKQRQWQQQQRRQCLLRLHIIFTIHIHTHTHTRAHTVARSQCITKTIGRVRTPIGHNYWRESVIVSQFPIYVICCICWPLDLAFSGLRALLTSAFGHIARIHIHFYEGARLDTAHACNGACLQRAYDKYTIWRASVRLHVV